MKKILFTLLFLVFALTSAACVCACEDMNNSTVVDDSINTIDENFVADIDEINDSAQIADIKQDVKQDNVTQKLEPIDTKENVTSNHSIFNKTELSSQKLYEVNDEQANISQIPTPIISKDTDLNIVDPVLKEKIKFYCDLYIEMLESISNANIVPRFFYNLVANKVGRENSLEDALIILPEVYNNWIKNHSDLVIKKFYGESMTTDDAMALLKIIRNRF